MDSYLAKINQSGVVSLVKESAANTAVEEKHDRDRAGTWWFVLDDQQVSDVWAILSRGGRHEAMVALFERSRYRGQS